LENRVFTRDGGLFDFDHRDTLNYKKILQHLTTYFMKLGERMHKNSSP
jgi:hypothetical protein